MCPSPAILQHHFGPSLSTLQPFPLHLGQGLRRGLSSVPGVPGGGNRDEEGEASSPNSAGQREEPLQRMEPFPWEHLPVSLGGPSLLTAACRFPDLSCPSHRAPWRLIPSGKAHSDSRHSHVSSSGGRESCVPAGPVPNPSHRVHPSLRQKSSSREEGEGAEVPPNRNGEEHYKNA